MSRTSFVFEKVGEDIYELVHGKWLIYIILYTILLIFFISISRFCYWPFLTEFVDILIGPSLFYIAYSAALVVLLDIRVENADGIGYKIAKAWSIFLVIMLITSMYFGNKYRNHYSFLCHTSYVEKGTGIYHVFQNCEEIKQTTTEMKGYEIEEAGYKLCENCEYIKESIEMEGENLQYRK